MTYTTVTRRAVLTGVGMSLLGSTARAEGTALSIGSGTAGGVYFPLGRAIAAILNASRPELNAAVVMTQGSIENMDGLGVGKFGIVFTQVDTAVNAADGEDHFNKKPLKVRALANLYSGRMQIVTVAGSGITRMSDLRGKRVSTGTPNSGNENMAYRLLKVAGVDRMSDFKQHEYLTPEEGTRRILAGELDAYFFNSGIPTATISDLGSRPGVEVRLVDHAELTAGIVARYGPVYFPEIIPVGTYPGQKTENKQVSVGNILAVDAALPDATVTAVLNAIWIGRAVLGETHKEGKNFTIEGQKTAAVGIPWHPAAEVFWKKEGASL